MSSVSFDFDLIERAACDLPQNCMFAAYDQFKTKKKWTVVQKKIAKYVSALTSLRQKFSMRYLNLNFAAHNQGRSNKCTISALSSLLMVQSPPLPSPMIKDMYMHARAIRSPDNGYTMGFLWRTFRWVVDSSSGLHLICLNLEGVPPQSRVRTIDKLMDQHMPFVTNLRGHAQLVLEKNKDGEYLVLDSSGIERGFAGYTVLKNFERSLEVLFVGSKTWLAASLDNCVVRHAMPEKQLASSWENCQRTQAVLKTEFNAMEKEEIFLRNYGLLETIPCVHVERDQRYAVVEQKANFVIVTVAKAPETFNFPEHFLQVGPEFHAAMTSFVKSAQFIEAYSIHPEFFKFLQSFDFSNVDGSDDSVVEAIRFVFGPFRSGFSLLSGELVWWSATKEYDNLCVKFSSHCPAQYSAYNFLSHEDHSAPCDPEYDGPDICSACKTKLPDIVRCRAICASGKRCTRGALDFKKVCRQHLNLLMGPI